MDGNDSATTAEIVDQLLTEIGRKRPRVRVLGFGALILRGRIWFIRYSHHGQRREESSRSDDQKVALRLLKKRVQECGKGRRLDPAKEERVRMSDLFDALETDYKNNGRRSADTLTFRLMPLREAFEKSRAIDVTATRIERYKAERLEAGKAPATVNRELAALRRAFAIAHDQERFTAAPRIRMLAEHNAREGFTTPEQFERIVAQLKPYLQDLARFAYTVGWRRGEPLTLEWTEIDYEGQRLRLRGAVSKNGAPRYLPYGDSPTLVQIIERRWQARTVVGDGARFVFHRNGKRIRDFRTAWEGATKRAGCPGLLFHDLRRSAVNNLNDANVPAKVAMEITGHKTMTTYTRYHIVRDDERRLAIGKIDAMIRARTANATPPAEEPSRPEN